MGSGTVLMYAPCLALPILFAPSIVPQYSYMDASGIGMDVVA